MSSSAICHQFACFSSINRARLNLRRRSAPCPTFRPKLSSTRCMQIGDSDSSHLLKHGTKVLVVMSDNGSGTWMSGSQTKSNLSYTLDASRSHIEGSANSFTTSEENFNGKGENEPKQDHCLTQKKRAAKIHDFCLGIPFGGFVLIGGLAGFIFTRNPTTLTTGVLYGGALLALSTFSLKVWRQGKSSLPFILGQAALGAVLLWKNMQTYSMTKKLFPTGFYAFISAAMLCFYSYVVVAGGNPPPKKLKASDAALS